MIPNNKQWRGATSVKDGLEKWQERKLQEYEGYQNDCVSGNVSQPNPVETLALSTLDADSDDFKLAWTSSTPRIAVIFQGSGSRTATTASLYEFLLTVRGLAEKKLRALNSKFEDFSCHLCLYVSGSSNTNVTCRSGQIFNSNGTKVENSSIVGYIQMDENHYLQWIPSNLRDPWKTDFRREKHFVRT